MALSNRIHTVKSPLPDVDGEPALLFESIQFHERLGTPFTATLNVLSENHEIDAGDLLKNSITVKIAPDPNTPPRYIDGIVTSLEYLGLEPGTNEKTSRYQLVLRPWFWLLTLRQNFRIFQDQDSEEIIREVFSDNGYSDFSFKLSGNYKKRTFCCQYRESDFNFISRLMEEEGIYYYFEHSDGAHRMKMLDANTSHSDFGKIPFRDPGARGRDIDYVSKWTAQNSVQTGKVVLTDYNFQSPKADLEVDSVERNNGLEFFDYPGRYFDSKTGQHFADVERQRLDAEHSIRKGVSNALQLTAGVILELQEAVPRSENGHYLVTEVNSAFASTDISFLQQDASVRQTDFLAIKKQTQFRPRRSAVKPVVTGPQSATVVGKGGEEIWTDQYGRIKVQFAWDRLGKLDENSSCWLRVSQTWAGTGWGAMHIPRIGQEVLVEFLNGDPDRPIVTGRVYNQNSPVPYELPPNQTQSGIKSRSTKGGSDDNFNEIRFEDKLGEEEIYLQAEKDFTQLVKNMFSMVVKESDHTTKIETGNHELTVAKGNKTTTITQGNYDVAVKAGKMTITAAQSIELKVGGSSIKIEPGQISISAPQVKVAGSAISEVSGGVVKISGSLVKIN